MGNKQTAVDWYVRQEAQLAVDWKNKKISGLQFVEKKLKLFEQAKAMEKQQILDAVNATIFDDDIDAYEYFTETYE
jgi:hypothetical protein